CRAVAAQRGLPHVASRAPRHAKPRRPRRGSCTMTQRFRLWTGGRIDRARPIAFRFDGVRYQGYEGDTLASALLANGVHMVARSFKYHRPRGIYTAGVEEPNALVQLGDGAHSEPNVRATTQELFE